MKKLTILLALSFGAIACGPAPTEMDLTEYDRACVQDRDCVLAIGGDVCSCSCDSQAINRKSIDRYRTDYNIARGECFDGEIESCGACPNAIEAFCDEGQCAAREVQ